MMLGRRIIIAALLCAVTAGCGFYGRRGQWKDVLEPDEPAPLFSDGTSRDLYDDLFVYKIGNGDGLRIDVAGHEEFSAPVGVDQRGRMAIPNTGEVVTVEGLALPEIEGLVSQVISPFVVGAPQVRVSLVSSTSKYYYVLGGVGRQGIYPMGAEIIHLREALALAGFFREYQADKRRVGIITPDPVQPTYLIVNGREVLMGVGEHDVIIKPGDVVFVQDRIIYDIDRFLYELFITTENVSTTNKAVKFWEDAKNGEFGDFTAPQRGLTIIY